MLFEQLICRIATDPLYPDASLGRRIAMNNRTHIKIEVKKSPHCCGAFIFKKD
jgi:hypothetical protein